jgi:hypothetical protein
MDKTNWDNKFEVGDEVRAWGILGKVTRVSDWGDLPVIATVQEKTYSFNQFGMFESWHKEPSLKFVSRKDKPEPEKLYWLWLCKRPDTTWMAMEFLDEQARNTDNKPRGLEVSQLHKKLHIPGCSPINSAGEYVAQPMEDKK